MPEPLIASEHVVVDADPLGGWTARDWTPGPAGTAGLELSGGVELDVDVASPTTLVGLWVPAAPADRAARALRRLLGDDRADALLAVAGGTEQLRVPGDGPTTRLGRRRGGPPGSAGPPGVEGRLARVALALDVAAEDRDPIVRGLAHIDAAAAGRELRLGAGSRASALAGVELLLDAARRGELDDRPVSAADLVATLDAVVPLLPTRLRPEALALGGRVASGTIPLVPVVGPAAETGEPMAAAGGSRRDFADRLQQRARVEEERIAPAAPVAAMAAPAPAPATKKLAVSALLEIDRAGLPLVFAGSGVAARATSSSEAEVRVPDRAREAHGWWARAHGVDGTVLAAAPFRPSGSDAVARLLVPPAALRHATFDVTDQPGEPRPSASVLAALEAVAAGREAARAERLWRPVEAAARWRRCASHWDDAGADQQAGLARRYLGEVSTPTSRVPTALLADAVVEAATDD